MYLCKLGEGAIAYLRINMSQGKCYCVGIYYCEFGEGAIVYLNNIVSWAKVLWCLCIYVS